ncbi:MAG: ATP-dependent 6-phosphofructokinase, partial [Solirubrobacterales bacterium]|nr:ATP-dependent 6-phosphofructokinase [Solirubrobacterales bacterium]
MARIGLLTGGGDCPGLNAVIRGVVRQGVGEYGDEFVGLRHGWAGIVAGEGRELGLPEVSGLLTRGGTILGSSRTNPYRDGGGGTEAVTAGMEKLGLDGLIAIGGEDTLGVATKLAADDVPVIGVPKTIDNDLAGTDYTFGFDTAVQVASDAIDRLQTTAESHDRVIVVEVMGRHAGWIACSAGIAGGAHAILVPERPFDLDELCDQIRARHSRGKNFSIVVASEGAVPKDGSLSAREDDVDEFGHPRLGGIGAWLEHEIERVTGYETRMVVLGHVQRGGTPTAYDRILATRYGVGAIDAYNRGERG